MFVKKITKNANAESITSINTITKFVAPPTFLAKGSKKTDKALSTFLDVFF